MQRAALIGLGMVADTHAAALRDAPELGLAGVLGRDPARARAFAARHGDVPVFDDLEALIAAAPDFVLLLTPPDARRDYVAALAAAGLPVLMEKPMERSLPAARELVEICATHDTPLGIVLQHRLRPAALALAEHIVDGTLGQIASVDLRVPWWREQSYYDTPGRGTYGRDGGGVLITQAIHAMDLMLHLCGPVQAVQAMTATTSLHDLEAEDFASASLRFASGAVGSLMASVTHYPGGSESLTLNGTKGSAHLSGAQLTLHLQGAAPQTIGAAVATGGGADPMAFSHAWHQAVIEEFAQSLRAGHAPAIPGTSALPVHALIDAITRSAASGKLTEVTQ